MSKYGDVAKQAVGLLLWEPSHSPAEAWAVAAERTFPDSPSSQEKGCPKGAFLGLCEEGLVAGVGPGDYTRSVLNKEYALRGLEALRDAPELINEPRQLWSIAKGDREIRPNHQMDVLATLWREGLVR